MEWAGVSEKKRDLLHGRFTTAEPLEEPHSEDAGLMRVKISA